MLCSEHIDAALEAHINSTPALELSHLPAKKRYLN